MTVRAISPLDVLMNHSNLLFVSCVLLPVFSAVTGCDRSSPESAPRAEPIVIQATPPSAAPPAPNLAPAPEEPAAAQPVTALASSPAKGAAEALDPKGAAAEANGQEPSGTATEGPAASGEGFRAHLSSAGAFQVGKPGAYQVVLTAAAPFHCNEKYPYKFTADAVPGVTYPANVVRGMQIEPMRSTMNVPFIPDQPGKKTLSGEFAFSVCTDDKCLVEKQKLSLTIDVKGAP